MFIALEGIDGVGKTTIALRLAKILESYGYRVFLTSEPTNSPIGVLIRDWLLKDEEASHPAVYALLFVADRVQHYHGVIRGYLDRGYVVITERYSESTIAYQGAMGLPIEWLEELHRFVPRPDLTVVLDAPLNVIAERLKSRGRLEKFERNLDFLAKAREILLKRASSFGYPIIDTNRDVGEVVNDVLNLVLNLLKRRV